MHPANSVVTDFAARFGIVNLAFFQEGLVDKIEFTIADQARIRKAAAANNADDWVQVIEQRLVIPATPVEQVALGMQKTTAPPLLWIMA
jgi:hypothetical protein